MSSKEVRVSDVSNYTELQLSELWERYGAFFTFSNKQFNEKRQEGVEYCHIIGGLVCPVNNAKVVVEEMNRIEAHHVKRMLEEVGVERIIRYELNNHEAYYTGNVTDTCEAVERYGITREQVIEVFINTQPA